MVKIFQGMGKTLHRCFDLVPDMNEGIETAITLGFERILTSGLDLIKNLKIFLRFC